MILNENDIPRGHLSTLILSCLNNGDKYGYEIIGEISDKTGIVIKQPSLYSSLKRMQDQDLISSYWMDSKIGGKRHYYRLTDYGKKQSLSWYNDLLSSSSDLARVLQNPDLLEKTNVETYENNSDDLESLNNKQNTSNNEIFLEQANIFATNGIKHDSETETIPSQEVSTRPKQDAFIQYNLFDVRSSFTAPADEKTDDAVFLNKEEKLPETNRTTSNPTTNDEVVYKNENVVNNENPTTISKKERGEHFDISSALSSLKNKTNSYSGGSSSQSNSYYDYIGKLQTSITDTSNDFVSTIKSKNVAGIDSKTQIISNKESDSTAILITESIDESVYKTKKIAPPVLDLNIAGKPGLKPTTTLENTNTKHMPYSDIISGVYEKANKQNTRVLEKQVIEKTEKGSLITNYQTLASGLSSRGVSLWQYNKNDEKISTNKTYIYSYKYSLVFYSMCFVLLVLSSVIPFLILSKTSYIQQNQLWLYIAPVCGYTLFALVSLIIKQKNKYKKINIREIIHINTYLKVAICILFMLVIYAVNVNLGLSAGNFNDYTTTFILPCVYALNIPLSSLIVYFSKKVRYIY